MTVHEATTGSVVERLGVRVDGDAAGLLGRRCGATRAGPSFWCPECSASTCRPTRGWSARPRCCWAGRVADALVDRPRPLPVEMLHAAVVGDRAAASRLHTAAERAIDPVPPEALVLGFAETATALGHCVAEGLSGAATCIPPRRPSPALPADPPLPPGGRSLVLVDDELSTGRTIRELHRVAPRERYVVAALVDVRPG